ncbi:MAG: DsbA family protein, partial [Bradymonadaceae bacterium]
METYLEDRDASPEIEWRPFDIQGHKRGPDGEIRQNVDDGKDEAYFERVWENVDRLSEEYDVEMQRLEPSEIDSWNAQKVALVIERDYEQSTFLAFHEALFEVLWKEGRDIGDPEVLVEVAEEHGIDPEDVHDAVEDEALDEELARKFDEARRMGVQGIPTFIFGERATQGAIPP